jgi:hypothetical protein
MIPYLDLLEVITVGFPFCAFKFIVGQHLVRTGNHLIGYPLLALFVIDTLINGVNLIALLIRRKRAMNACLFSIKAQHGSNQEDFGNSIDMLFSFALVAYMVGMQYLGGLNDLERPIWNIAVVLNVLGAGISRLTHSYRNL